MMLEEVKGKTAKQKKICISLTSYFDAAQP
jgi:hypothetical protein